MASIKDQIRVAFAHDGKDHVNIFTHGETNVGKVAFPEWRRNFYIPHLGEFASPRAFANWCVSGGQEEFRRQTGYVEYRVENIREFRALMLYAKFYQLTSLRASLIDEKHLLELPWMMYKKHLTGVKEHNRWEEYPRIAKAYVEHIVNHGNHVKFNFEAVVPGMTEIVNKYLRAFIGEEFVGIDKIDELRSTSGKVTKSQKVGKRGQVTTVHLIDEAGLMDVPDGQPEANDGALTAAPVPSNASEQQDPPAEAQHLQVQEPEQERQVSAEEGVLTGAAEDAQVA